jgi:hypothetical protein
MAKPGSIRVKLQTGHPLYVDADLRLVENDWDCWMSRQELEAKRREYGEHEAAHRSSRRERPATKTLERRSSSGAVERSTHLLLHKKRPLILCAFTSHSTVTPLLETVKWDSSWSTPARSAL